MYKQPYTGARTDIEAFAICLKSEARAWLKVYEAELRAHDPPVALELEALKQALQVEFVKEEDPDKV